jgi:hypothetical protein
MTAQQHAQVARFLEEQRLTIVGLLEQAYMVTGGHYATLTVDERHAQAERDSREFIDALLRGAPDRAAIRRTAQDAPGPELIMDIVRMVTVLENLFKRFVQNQLASEPALARELVLRGTFVMGRFRLSMSAAHLDSVVNGFDATWSLAELPRQA